LQETFNLDNVSDGSQEGSTDPARVPELGPATPSHRSTDPVKVLELGPATPSRRQRRMAGKAGSRHKMGDDAQTFFKIVDGKKFCTFCL